MSYRRRRLVNDGSAFSPTQLSKVSAWLRNTTTSGDVTEWTNQLDSNHAVANAARAPVGGASAGNGKPTLTFTSANNDAMAWPLDANNNQTTKTGFAFWMRQPTSVLETLFCIYNGTNGASARKLFFQTNTSRRLVLGVYISGNDGRQGMTAVNALPTAGDWAWVRLQYDSSGATEADKAKIFINGVDQSLSFVNLGSGGTLGELPTVTGNAIIGNLNDGTSLVGFNGDYGPNLYALNDNLTADEETNLKNFDAPT